MPGVAALVVFAALVALGAWQLERAADKRALEREFERRLRDEPVHLDEAATDAAALRHRRVTATGVYDAAHQFLLDNRTRQGAAGYHVLTPLRLPDEGTAVLVNRGWVPVGRSREQLPRTAAPAGAVHVRGIVAVPSAEPFLLGPAGYDAGGWPRVVQAIDLVAMEAALGYPLLPYTVRLAPGEAGGFAREWEPYIGLGPERHRGYAVQWFALAAAVLVIFVVLTLRRRR